MTLISLLLLLVLPHPPHGSPRDRPIVIRHDRPDSAYVALGERYAPILAWVEERSEGILIAARWVLTAAHNVASLGPFDAPYVILGGERYEVDKIILHPEWEGGWPDLLQSHDLALLRLERDVVGIEPAALYPYDDEQGREVTLLGRGKTGTGLTGPQGEKGDVIRGATNRVDGVSETVLLMVFDNPEDGTDGHTELEGQGGAGDSGGPALIERDRQVYVAGVGSFGTGHTGTASYGTIDGYIRVSAFREWIESTIEADPPPTQAWSRPAWYEGPHPYPDRLAAAGRAAPLPDSPIGRAASALLDALASGGVEALIEFHRRFGVPGGGDPEGMAERLHAGLYEAYGVPRVFGWSASGDLEIRLLFYSVLADAWRSLGLVLARGEPRFLERIYLKWESAPKPEIWN